MRKKLIESERKFLVGLIPDIPEARSFLILQWYKDISDDCEQKLKLLIRLSDKKCDLVSVEKRRHSAVKSAKTITYLDPLTFNFGVLDEMRLVVKSRRVIGHYSFDFFIVGSKPGLMILEVDNGASLINWQDIIIREVTHEHEYMNSHMARMDTDWNYLIESVLK
jgi:CYTH domain-containing protein